MQQYLQIVKNDDLDKILDRLDVLYIGINSTEKDSFQVIAKGNFSNMLLAAAFTPKNGWTKIARKITLPDATVLKDTIYHHTSEVEITMLENGLIGISRSVEKILDNYRSKNDFSLVLPSLEPINDEAISFFIRDTSKLLEGLLGGGISLAVDTITGELIAVPSGAEPTYSANLDLLMKDARTVKPTIAILNLFMNTLGSDEQNGYDQKPKVFSQQPLHIMVEGMKMTDDAVIKILHK
jgi:hypothetical protein